MTDNEIIKALECCISSSTSLACFKCPMAKNKECNGSNTNVNKLVVEDALDLINRQKAEIESLRVSNTDMFATISKQDAEIERLNVRIKDLTNYQTADVETRRSVIANAKSEAIKEFWEMYERAIEQLLTSATIEQAYVIYECLDKFKALSYRECTKTCNEIPKKLEEMVGDDNA